MSREFDILYENDVQITYPTRILMKTMYCKSVCEIVHGVQERGYDVSGL